MKKIYLSILCFFLIECLHGETPPPPDPLTQLLAPRHVEIVWPGKGGARASTKPLDRCSVSFDHIYECDRVNVGGICQKQKKFYILEKKGPRPGDPLVFKESSAPKQKNFQSTVFLWDEGAVQNVLKTGKCDHVHFMMGTLIRYSHLWSNSEESRRKDHLSPKGARFGLLAPVDILSSINSSQPLSITFNGVLGPKTLARYGKNGGYFMPALMQIIQNKKLKIKAIHFTDDALGVKEWGSKDQSSSGPMIPLAHFLQEELLFWMDQFIKGSTSSPQSDLIFPTFLFNTLNLDDENVHILTWSAFVNKLKEKIKNQSLKIKFTFGFQNVKWMGAKDDCGNTEKEKISAALDALGKISSENLSITIQN